MLNVRVCPSCLNRRSSGLSRVSEDIWNACLEHLRTETSSTIVEQDEMLNAYADREQTQLLMSNEDGFAANDELVKHVILDKFRSQRLT